jgi:hypothetical protein
MRLPWRLENENESKNLKFIEGRIEQDIFKVLDREELQKLAVETKFVQRSTGRIGGFEFVLLLAIVCMMNPDITLGELCDCLAEMEPKSKMKPQALCQRINSEHAADFLREVLALAIRKNLESVKSLETNELLSHFKRVFLHDSTQMKLNEKLSKFFKGSGGSASKSIMKIDVLYEMLGDVIQNIHLTDYKEPDQRLAALAMDHIGEGDLVIQDLGYFSVAGLRKVEEAGAFFLSRLFGSVNVRVPEFGPDAVKDLGDFLLRNFPEESAVELDILIGAERFPCRLVAYRLPESVVNQRIRKARAAAAKKGRQLTDEQRNWLEFGLFITNVGKDVWPAGVVGTIYRIRWRIELVFKSWKSLLGINVLKGTRPERIRCFVYGRLVAIAIMTVLYSYASWYALSEHAREASDYKFFNWLKNLDRVKKAIFSGSFSALFEEIKREVLNVCKQKRKRKTTLELIESAAPYPESFEPRKA